MSWIYFRVIQEGCRAGREEEEEAKLIVFTVVELDEITQKLSI